MKVIIAGGSGYIGTALTRSLLADGHEVVAVSRQPGSAAFQGRAVGWDAVAGEIDGADAVVNLAGTSIGGPRWTSRRKESIRSSRTASVEAVA